MKAVVYNKNASSEKFTYKNLEKPSVKDDEILIEIHATSINALDYRSMRMGQIPKKKIFGADVSGKVEAVGKNVKRFKIGDEVIADLSDYGFGGFAEYVAGPEAAFVSKPVNISHAEAAALPVASMTALQAIQGFGDKLNGKEVLIIGSGGGVGTFAIQLATYFNAKVTAICSTKNVQQSITLGANHVIDYTKEDFTKSDKKYDLTLAINGNYSIFAYIKTLKKHGRCAVVGGSLKQVIKTFLFAKILSLGSKKIHLLRAKSNQKDLEFIARLAKDSKIKAIIEQSYPLKDAAKAMHYIEKGHASGKIVLHVQ